MTRDEIIQHIDDQIEFYNLKLSDLHKQLIRIKSDMDGYMQQVDDLEAERDSVMNEDDDYSDDGALSDDALRKAERRQMGITD